MIFEISQGDITHDPGLWISLTDELTGFGHWNVRHPFVLPYGFNPDGRRAFAIGLLRTSTKPTRTPPSHLQHDAHTVCDGEACKLNRRGWILGLRFQVTGPWLNESEPICTGDTDAVLGQIQVFEDEQAT
jgi:hypothetical protein